MTRNTLKSIKSLIMSGLFLLPSASVRAQAPKNTNAANPSALHFTKPAVVVKAAPVVKSTMAAEERFDDVPQYTGKSKFVRGTKYDSEHNVMYLETLHVHETRDQILDWYKRSLSAIGWQVSVNAGALSGFKKGSENTVSIIVNEIPLNDNFRCEVVVQASRKK